MVTAVVEVLAWEGVLVLVWVTTLSSAPVGELWLAVGSCLPCAVLGVLARKALRVSWRPRLRWLRWVPYAAATIVLDALRVLGQVARRAVGGPRPIGQFRGLQLRPDPNAAVAATHRALATTTLATSPGMYVVDDPDDGALTVHELAGGWPHVDRTVAS